MNDELVNALQSLLLVSGGNNPRNAQRVILLMIQYKLSGGAKPPALDLDGIPSWRYYQINAVNIVNSFLANPSPENFALAVAEIASGSVWGLGKK